MLRDRVQVGNKNGNRLLTTNPHTDSLVIIMPIPLLIPVLIPILISCWFPYRSDTIPYEQALEDSARAYNSVAEDLKVVPCTAKYARGRNLSMNVDVKAKKRDGLLKTDVRKDILPALQELRTGCLMLPVAIITLFLPSLTAPSVISIQTGINKHSFFHYLISFFS